MGERLPNKAVSKGDFNFLEYHAEAVSLSWCHNHFVSDDDDADNDGDDDHVDEDDDDQAEALSWTRADCSIYEGEDASGPLLFRLFRLISSSSSLQYLK